MAYTRVQRKDKGFDFYNPQGKKIFVDEYVKATGANKNQLVNDMAKAGDVVSKAAMRANEYNNFMSGGFDLGKRNQMGLYRAQLVQAANDVNNKDNRFARETLSRIKTDPLDQAGDFARGSNQTFYGNTTRNLVKSANIVGSGFNDQVANDRTNSFLSDLKQSNALTQGADLNSEAGKWGQAVGQAMNTGRDLALMAVPGTAATNAIAKSAMLNKAIQGTNLAAKVKRGVVANVGGGLVSSGVAQGLNPEQSIGENFGYGAAVDAGLSLLGPVVGSTVKALRNPVTRQQATQAAKTAVEATTQPVKYAAKQDPRVTGFDDQYSQLAQRFDNLPAGSSERNAVSRAMAQNRQERLGVMRSVQREIGQGGYIAGPGAWGFKKAQAEGKVFEGVDGKPRFEVDDSGAKILDDYFDERQLQDVLDHPDLYKNYPELKNLKIVEQPAFKGTNSKAAYDRKENAIAISPDLMKKPEELRSTILHEVQHAIQNREGFARGGGHETVGFNQVTDDEYRSLTEQIRKIRPEANKVSKLINDAFMQNDIDAVRKLSDSPILKKQSELVRKQNVIDIARRNPQHGYERLAGEAEARAVQARMDMPMSERYVDATQKVRLDDLQGVETGDKSVDWKFDQRKAPPIKIDQHGQIRDGHHRYYAAKDAFEADQKLYNEGKVDDRYMEEKWGDVNFGEIDATIKDKPHLGKGWGKEKKRSTFYDSLDVPKEDLIIRNDGGKAMSEVPKTVKVWTKSKFSERGGYSDVPVVRRVDNTTLYQGKGAGEQRQFWTANKEYAKQFGEVREKTGSFYEVDNGNRVTTVYVDAKPQSSVAMSIDDPYAKTSEFLDDFDAKYLNEQVASHSTPEQFRQSIIDRLWEQNKKGSGVDSWLQEAGQGEGTGYVGRAAMTNNSKFYSDFYKEYGRKPSKKAIEDMVDQSLGIKKGGEFKNLLNESEVTPLDADIYRLIKERNEPTAQATQTRANQTVEPQGYKASTNRKPLPKQEAPQKATQSNAQPVNQGQPKQNRTQPRAIDTQPLASRTYDDNTPLLDTKQYVDELNKSQEAAGKGDLKIKTAGKDLKATMVDDLAPIEDRLNKAIKEGASVDPKDHITYQLDRSRRAEGITHAYIQDNGLDKIIQDVPNPKEFDQYLIARHAKELDESIKTGRNAVKDAQLVKALDGKYKAHAEELYKYNRGLLDKAAEYGLINKRTAAALKKQYPDYVPLNRIFKEDELVSVQGNAKADASISKQSAVQKLKGSERAIASPLNSIIDKTRVVIEQGERNKAANMLADYRSLEGNPFNLKEIPASETIGTRHTISYLEKGKKRTFEVDEEIAEAAKHMSREQIGLIGRVVAMPARILRAGATGVNVGFAGANVVKDMVGAAINSKHPFRIADPKNFAKALSSALHHNGKHYQELMREGVAGTSFDMYRNPLKSNVGEIRSQKNIATRAAHNLLLPQNWYRTLENTIGRSEDFGRALQYYSNKSGELAKGKSEDVAKILAGDAARNNSTNFFRSGSVGKHVNLAVPYFNAGVQGARIQTRRIKERPAQTLGKMAAVIAMPSVAIAMNNYSDEKKREVISQIPDYEKKGNIIIVGPNAKYNEETREWDDVYKLPVPPQHTGIHMAIQKAVESAFTGEEYDLVAALGGVSENYLTVDPTDPRAIANKLTPQAVKLIAEPMTNTNFFTGNKIVPDSQKNLPNKDQVGDGTSGTAKVIGNLTNNSPRVIDNLFRTGTGGAGQNLINATDSALAATGVIKPEEVRGTSIPSSIGGRFYGANKTPTSEKIEKQFAGLKEEVINSSAYKQASAYDKSRMLNRLESDISAVEYSAEYSDQKLTKKQQAMKDGGFNLDTYTNLDSKAVADTKLAKNTGSYKFLQAKPEMTTEEESTWKKQKIADSDRGMIDALNGSLPEGLPRFEGELATNEIAELYANYQKNKADKGWSELQSKREGKKLFTEAYKSLLSDNERYISSMADKDIISAIGNGDIGSDELNNIIGVDNILSKLGLSPLISNSTRRKLGIATVAGSGGSGGSSGFTQADIEKLVSTNKLGTSTASSLLDLLNSTSVKGKTSTPQTQKVALKKITVKG